MRGRKGETKREQKRQRRKKGDSQMKTETDGWRYKKIGLKNLREKNTLLYPKVTLCLHKVKGKKSKVIFCNSCTTSAGF